MRRLIVGDIHSHYDMLISALGKASFCPESDVLYSVGDILDRGGKPVETLRYLMSLPDFRPVLGNHDAYFESYLWNEEEPDIDWLMGDGGSNTVKEVSKLGKDERRAIRDFYSSFPVVRSEDDIIVVHGGIPAKYTEAGLAAISAVKRPVPLLSGSDSLWLEDFLWNRSYLYSAMEDSAWARRGRKVDVRVKPVKTKKTIFIGHTQLRPECRPFVSKKFHLVAIDTGAGSGQGPLTVMDIDTKEYWQADADGIRL